MKHSIAQTGLACMLAFGALTTPAFAATYSDRASFEAAANNLTTLDFEGVIGTAGFANNYPFGTGHMAGIITLQDVQFSDAISSGGIDYVYILANDGAGASGSLNGTAAIWLGRDSSRIALPAGITAFGTDFGIAPGDVVSTIEATVYYRSSIPAETFNWAVTSSSQFFGYTGPEIDRIDLSYVPNAYMVLDNLSIAQAVPEPETYALMLAGLGLVGFAARRQK
jgi:hypothetical protein